MRRAGLWCALVLCILPALSSGCAKSGCANPGCAKPGCAKPGCANPGSAVSAASDCPAWAERLGPASQGLASWSDLTPALDASLAYLRARPEQAPFRLRPGSVRTRADLIETLETLRALLPELERDPGLLRERFDFVPVGEETLLTGYYEPEIRVSPTRTGRFVYPVYAPPQGDDRRLARERIDFEGALEGKGLELAWAEDIVDVFFMQVQGSGVLAFPDGSKKRALYAGGNGRDYVGVGNLLVRMGAFPESEKSMQRIRRHFRERPQDIRPVLSQNPSYVFFELSDGGPRGAMGERLTPRVSLAVDRAFLPFGAVIALDANIPSPDGAPERFTGLTLAQDTGAMRGDHVDLYLGPGALAAYQAGHMKSGAETFLLTVRKTEGDGAGGQ